MASIQDVQTAIANLVAHVATESGQVSAKIDGLTAQIAALQDQINQGGVVTSAQLDDVVASLVAAQTQVDAIVPDAPPIPTPDPVPTP